jgi:hypothetical protein
MDDRWGKANPSTVDVGMEVGGGWSIDELLALEFGTTTCCLLGEAFLFFYPGLFGTTGFFFGFATCGFFLALLLFEGLLLRTTRCEA